VTDTNREQQADALIARMKKARGYMYPEWEFAARQDPEFVEAYNRLYEQSLGEGQHVSAKVREFVAIALLCFRGGERGGLVAHMKRAIQLGATPAELPALRAFLERPDLDAVRASSVEVYGDCDPPPQAIVMLRGVDPNIGLITKYGLIEPHAD